MESHDVPRTPLRFQVNTWNIALDADGNEVHAKGAPTGRRYTCTRCRQPMVAKTRDFPERVTQKHFAHVATNAACNPAEAVHKTIQRLITDSFNEAVTNETPYFWEVRCEHKHTILRRNAALPGAVARTEVVLVPGTRSDIVISGFEDSVPFKVIIEIVVTRGIAPNTREAYEISGLPVLAISLPLYEEDYEDLRAELKQQVVVCRDQALPLLECTECLPRERSILVEPGPGAKHIVVGNEEGTATVTKEQKLRAYYPLWVPIEKDSSRWAIQAERQRQAETEKATQSVDVVVQCRASGGYIPVLPYDRQPTVTAEVPFDGYLVAKFIQVVQHDDKGNEWLWEDTDTGMRVRVLIWENQLSARLAEGCENRLCLLRREKGRSYTRLDGTKAQYTNWTFRDVDGPRS